MIRTEHIILPGPHRRPISLDVSFRDDLQPKPILVFSHGFKGFKDWGHFNLMAKHFASEGFVFIKFNFSHNGTTLDTPYDFNDLEAFAQNNFSKELDDLGSVIDWSLHSEILKENILETELFLLGHSRGGGISLLKTNEDSRIRKVVSWASPCSFEKRYTPQEVEYWKKIGVIYVENARTRQQMPLHYQIVEDYFNNVHRLHIENATRNIKVPSLIVQGAEDDVIALEEAQLLHSWNPLSKLLIIEKGNHTFGAEHPYVLADFPSDFKKVFEETCRFLKI